MYSTLREIINAELIFADEWSKKAYFAELIFVDTKLKRSFSCFTYFLSNKTINRKEVAFCGGTYFCGSVI